MPYIQCKEPGCAEIISSPYTSVHVLLGINSLMQTIKQAPLDTESQKNVNELLDKVKVEIQNNDIRQQEIKNDVTENKQADLISQEDSPTSKVIILECILKHRHSYQVNND